MLAPEPQTGRDVHAAAAKGISGGGGALPHKDKIQQSFGGYDISNVQAHTDGAAAQGAAAMGADAYATGNHIVLGDGGDTLHTVAHEAAHVVQQRAGVALSGGVGKSGDVFEKHADAVGDAVVAGKSAEGLLDEMSIGGSGRGETGVQMKPDPSATVAPIPGEVTTDATEVVAPSAAERASLLERAQALTTEMYARSNEVRAAMANAVSTMAAPPTLADIEGLAALVADYESQLMTWRPTLMALDVPTTHWALEEAAMTTGPDLESVFNGFKAAFQQANDVLFESSDTHNGAEIQREHDLAAVPGKQKLRDAPPQGGSRGDRDWAPIHVPGLVITTDPMTNRAPSIGRARAASEITTAVIHTGASTTEKTVDALQGRDQLVGHYAVGIDGDTSQMHPPSQVGAHAGKANRPSVAIDLAYGSGSAKDSQVAFLDSGVQLIATAKIILSHARLSPALANGGPHARGELFGGNLDNIESLGGAYGGVAKFAADRDAEVMAGLEGVVAHEAMPDSDHSDPGQVYMLRLHAMLPLLEAYEQRYGPVRLDDPSEVERVIGVIERYEIVTGRPAAGVSQTELWRRVIAHFGSKPLPDVAAGALDEVLDKTLTALQDELARARLGEDYDKKREQVRDEIPAEKIAFEGSIPEKKILRKALALGPDDDLKAPEHAKAIATARTTSGYVKAREDFRTSVRTSLSQRIVRDTAYVDAAVEDLAAFRRYLAKYLPELIR